MLRGPRGVADPRSHHRPTNLAGRDRKRSRGQRGLGRGSWRWRKLECRVGWRGSSRADGVESRRKGRCSGIKPDPLRGRGRRGRGGEWRCRWSEWDAFRGWERLSRRRLRESPPTLGEKTESEKNILLQKSINQTNQSMNISSERSNIQQKYQKCEKSGKNQTINQSINRTNEEGANRSVNRSNERTPIKRYIRKMIKQSRVRGYAGKAYSSGRFVKA